MNKTLINFLSILKNASIAKKSVVKAPKTHAASIYLPILYREGVILSYSFHEINSRNPYVLIHLRKFQHKNLAEDLKNLSLPSRTKNLSLIELSQICFKNKILVLSTSKGIMSSFDCLKHKVGGVAMFSC